MSEIKFFIPGQGSVPLAREAQLTLIAWIKKLLVCPGVPLILNAEDGLWSAQAGPLGFADVLLSCEGWRLVGAWKAEGGDARCRTAQVWATRD